MSEMVGSIGSGGVADQQSAAAKARESSDIRKVAVASAIGNMIEYYDFTLYATATALVFNKIFFPSTDPLVGSLLAFATFFVGYCARPLGGVLFGHFGDRVGRKTALLLTILIMGLGTFLIGFMPTYEQVGVLAPICLIGLRLLQGIGIGGEYGGGMTMTVEHAPADRRGFFSSLVHVGVPAGFLIPIALLGLLSNSMSEGDFLAWGWRIPFLFSIVLVGIGIFIRFRISETPAFKRVLNEEGAASVPVVEAMRNHPGNILFGIGAKIAESGLFNIYAVFAITYCKTKHWPAQPDHPQRRSGRLRAGMPDVARFRSALGPDRAASCLCRRDDLPGRARARVLPDAQHRAHWHDLACDRARSRARPRLGLWRARCLLLGAVPGAHPLQRPVAGAAVRADSRRRPVAADRDSAPRRIRLTLVGCRLHGRHGVILRCLHVRSPPASGGNLSRSSLSKIAGPIKEAHKIAQEIPRRLPRRTLDAVASKLARAGWRSRRSYVGSRQPRPFGG
ncbi:MFS family permease [Bradyrhizobium sp. GM5.1]